MSTFRFYLVSLFLFTFLMCSFSAYAKESYFDFYTDSYVLDSSSALNIKIVFNMDEAAVPRFIVRPIVEHGAISIWDESNETWILGNSLWSTLPKLQKEFLIKVIGLDAKNTNLHFLIQDTKTAEIYETPKKPIWDFSNKKNYILKLNENILSWEESRALLASESIVPVLLVEENSSNNREAEENTENLQRYKRYILIAVSVVIITVVVITLFIFRKKQGLRTAFF